jgi:hypothetical protein
MLKGSDVGLCLMFDVVDGEQEKLREAINRIEIILGQTINVGTAEVDGVEVEDLECVDPFATATEADIYLRAVRNLILRFMEE